MNEHPSYLALDRAALGAADAPVLEHARACERCGAHLERLRAVDPLPAGLHLQPRKRRWLPLSFAAAAAAAAAAVLALALVLPGREVSRPKGPPQMTLFVKHGEHVYRWDGIAPLEVGDEIRLEVREEGFREITISTRENDRERVLYEGPLSGENPELVPAAWKLDDTPGTEELSVRLKTEDHMQWVQQFIIPKRTVKEEK